MLRHASADEAAIGDADRERWLAMVPGLHVTEECGCGTCPSVDLGPQGGARSGRIVLNAGAPGLGVLVFIDDDRPSRLEGYPIEGDGVVLDFPPARDLGF
ncbi:hypothetical protein ACQP1U_04865 [Actinomycetota bacterium]